MVALIIGVSRLVFVVLRRPDCPGGRPQLLHDHTLYAVPKQRNITGEASSIICPFLPSLLVRLATVRQAAPVIGGVDGRKIIQFESYRIFIAEAGPSPGSRGM